MFGFCKIYGARRKEMKIFGRVNYMWDEKNKLVGAFKNINFKSIPCRKNMNFPFSCEIILSNG